MRMVFITIGLIYDLVSLRRLVFRFASRVGIGRSDESNQDIVRLQE